jgi:tetratricopeptide (TPR) repeat protein
VWFLLFAQRTPALTERDTILLADVINTTGDAVFDGTLKQALAVALGQSPYLNVYGDSQARDALVLMNRPPDERITRDIAREMCERQALKAMLVTSIAPLGSHYVLTLEAVNARTGETLAREQAEAPTKEQVLTVLGQAASALRRSLGESLATLEKFDAPLSQVTTSSLEALKAYPIGRRDNMAGRHAQAIPFFKKAIEIDPNFASAYNGLAASYQGVVGHDEDIRRATAKAFELRDRLAGRERMQIVSVYHSLMGNLEKAIEANQLYVRTYPNDATPRNNLAWMCLTAGDYQQAVQQATEGLRINPGIAVLYSNLGWSYRALGRYEEAKATFAAAAARKLDFFVMHYNLYVVAFAQGDAAGMERQLRWAAGKPEESRSLIWQADTEAFAGRFRQAAVTTRRALDAADRNGLTDERQGALASAALTHALVGDCQPARTEAAAAVAGAAESFSGGIAALALAVCGDAPRAHALAAALARRQPEDTGVNALLAPSIAAVIETGRGNAAQAIRALQKARPYELGQTLPFWPQYFRGLAYSKLGAATDAMAEFQTIIDHRSVSPAELAFPLAHVGLARAAALAGDVPKSRKAYQDFFALWKDADADIPILQQARREYQTLR